MASSGKRKTTMAKLNRERKLLERRAEKQVKKQARRQAASQPPEEPGLHVAAGPDAPSAETA